MPTTMTKDPGASLDYSFDWGAWLVDGDTITSAQVTVPDGITLDGTTNTASTVTAWLSGGTAGESYMATCRITTAEGRTDERSIRINVRQR